MLDFLLCLTNYASQTITEPQRLNDVVRRFEGSRIVAGLTTSKMIKQRMIDQYCFMFPQNVFLLNVYTIYISMREYFFFLLGILAILSL